jgi:hypothetical protein
MNSGRFFNDIVFLVVHARRVKCWAVSPLLCKTANVERFTASAIPLNQHGVSIMYRQKSSMPGGRDPYDESWKLMQVCYCTVGVLQLQQQQGE